MEKTIYFAITSCLIVVLGLLGFFFYRCIILPVREIRREADRFALGNFDSRLPRYYIKEINELASTLNDMGAQLNKLEQIRRDFVANVSHELKTPITSIKGFAETLLAGAKETPEDLERFLEIISKQSERLAAIVEDLLTIARLEGERLDELLLPTEEELYNVIANAISVLEVRAKRKSISIEIECDQDLLVKIDRHLVEQALINLVDNAIKYSGEGSTIWLKVFKEAREVRVDVIDQGLGIPAEHLPRLFERFYRVDKARSRSLGGTGLGLSIVKHIAVVHKGQVSVQSVLGKGSTFSISFAV